MDESYRYDRALRARAYIRAIKGNISRVTNRLAYSRDLHNTSAGMWTRNILVFDAIICLPARSGNIIPVRVELSVRKFAGREIVSRRASYARVFANVHLSSFPPRIIITQPTENGDISHRVRKEAGSYLALAIERRLKI